LAAKRPAPMASITVAEPVTMSSPDQARFFEVFPFKSTRIGVINQ
jgi:hypothetical protein